MNKKILIGSMLVLTLLLLMPSISAIQNNIITENIKQEWQDKIETIKLDELKDIDLLDRIMHPLLQNIVKSLGYCPPLLNLFVAIVGFSMVFRSIFLEIISTEGMFNEWHITNPIIYLRAEWLFLLAISWFDFWIDFFDDRGWIHTPW